MYQMYILVHYIKSERAKNLVHVRTIRYAKSS